MALDKSGRLLLMDLINAQRGESTHFTDETFSAYPPRPYTDSNHPHQNTQVSVAFRADPTIRMTYYYPRLDLARLSYGKSADFTVTTGATVADIIDDINERLGLAQTAIEFRPMEFWNTGEYWLEPTADNFLLVGRWRINVTVSAAA